MPAAQQASRRLRRLLEEFRAVSLTLDISEVRLFAFEEELGGRQPGDRGS